MKLVHVILGVHMGAAHIGLTRLAEAHGIDLDKLKQGECVIFINSAKDKLKAFSHNKVVSYVRFDDKNRKIDMNALDEIPKAFDASGAFDYSRALKASLTKRLQSSKRFNKTELI